MKSVFFFLLILTFSAHAQKKFQWPDGKKAAIVLTYDDALASQLNVAIPQLDSLHFKGTFFLTAGFNEKEMQRWQSANKRGHELGNHTLYHPCSSTIIKANPHYALENYDTYTLLREISVMNKLLYAMDNKTNRTYAFPCSETAVGGKDYTDSLRLSGLIKYARSGGDNNSIITNFESLNPYQVPSWGFANNPDGKQLIDFVKKAQQAGGMGVFMFHGVGGDYLTVSAEAHQQLLQYLSNHKSEIWVGTFQEVMDYVMKKREN